MFPVYPSPARHRSQPPAIVVVDDFYINPGSVIADAAAAEYEADLRYFKGLRSKQKFLYPYVKEEFERLLGLRILDWLDQPANGSFQKTTATDPLVWHSDTQHYAAAIYLTSGDPVEPVEYGTSFWRNRSTHARRPPTDPEFYARTYSEYNLTHEDDWELVDRVGSVFNRLVLWDASLIHSASRYPKDSERLVQLFFFNVSR